MTVWLDLIVTPTNQLGTLEELGNTVTPELARRVVRFISRKYHPRVMSEQAKFLTIGRHHYSRSSRYSLS